MSAQPTPARALTRAVRASLIAGLALVAACLEWRLHPGHLAPAATPDGDIVLACGWAGWLVAGYLLVAVAAAALGQLGSPHALPRLAPPMIRRLVETTVSVGVLTALTGSGIAAATPARIPAVAAAPLHAAGQPLDWPGLTVLARSPSAATHSPTPTPSPASTVVVRPGDTLWSIAADRLGLGASPDRVAASWPQWYAANRDVIGANPGLIHPGERLVPPSEEPGSQT